MIKINLASIGKSIFICVLLCSSIYTALCLCKQSMGNDSVAFPKAAVFPGMWPGHLDRVHVACLLPWRKVQHLKTLELVSVWYI